MISVSNHFKYDQWFQIISNMISGFKQFRIWLVISNHFKYDQWFQATSNMISGFKPLQIWSVESNNFKYQWFETRRFLSLQGNYMYNFDPVLADNSENQNKLLTTTKIKKNILYLLYITSIQKYISLKENELKQGRLSTMSSLLIFSELHIDNTFLSIIYKSYIEIRERMCQPGQPGQGLLTATEKVWRVG